MWGSTFADFAKRATELQEQASHLAATKSLFNLDGLQQAKSGDEHDQTITTAAESRSSIIVTKPDVADVKEQHFPTTTTLHFEDQVEGPLVISDTANTKGADFSHLESGSQTLDVFQNVGKEVVNVAAANNEGGKDGWEEEEDVEEFDFESSPGEQEHQDHDVFTGDNEEIMESMLQPLDMPSSENVANDQVQPPVITPDKSVAKDEKRNLQMDQNEPKEAPLLTDASPQVEQSVSDAQTLELDKVGEPDGDMVFNDDDDGLDDMYDDEEDEEEEEKTIEKPEGKQRVVTFHEATSDVGTQQPLAAAAQETLDATTAEQEQVKAISTVENEEQSNRSGPKQPETDDSKQIRRTAEEQRPTTAETDQNESLKTLDKPYSINPITDDEGSIVHPQELQPKAAALEEKLHLATDQFVREMPEQTTAPNFTSDTVKPAPSERALPDSSVPLSNDQLAQSDNSLADRLLEQFSQQMQRLDENHQAELRERDQQHALELEKALASLSHDKCEEQRRQMEERLLETLRQKDEQLMELLKTNEGHKLKIDVLKRELEGTRELLAEKESVVGNVHAARDKDIKGLERKLKQKDDDLTAAKERYEQLSVELKEVKNELETTNDSYSTLKGRVKVVATELKDRRVECRNLGIEVAELTESNESLKTQLSNLQSQLADQNRSQSEKDEELEQLRTKLVEMEGRLKVAEKSIKEADSVNEKALASYKKKAQAALAEANARAAAASQAREEAELEARAARSTADAAMERARVAEAAGKEALAEAKSYVKDLEDEKSRFETDAQELRQSLNVTVEQLSQVRSELDDSRMAQDKLSRDLEQMCRNLEAERAKSQELEEDLCDSRRRSNELHDQLETFREELQRSTTATFGAGTYSETSGKASIPENNGHLNVAAGPTKLADKSDAEATIIILQQELHDANRAIRELKETLRVAIEQQAEHALTSHVALSPQRTNGFHTDNLGQGNDSTPLYFAMEKQAELNLARDEINRLANLLGDAESSKMEAYEAMDEMRRKMEEAEARLKRFEKMGSAASRGSSSRIVNQTFSPRDGNHQFGVDDTAHGRTGADETIVDSAVVNLEYLKNVMLSYLNAKTLQEKKALVPVIGAVLCLTAEEQTKALKTIEDTGGFEGVGQALLESFGSARLF